MQNLIKKMVKWVRVAMPYRNPFLQIIDVIWHKLKINTHPSDYYRYMFYKRDKSWEEKRRYVGRLGSYYWPYEGIKLKDMSLLTNKYIFKHLLFGMDLPTPELLATVGLEYGVWSCDELKDRLKSWHFDFVIKPISSTGGKDVIVLIWDDGRFIGRKGGVWTADFIWEYLSRHLEDGFLIERRVFNVGQTKKIHPHTLNTFRIVTIRTKDGKWHVLDRFMRFGCGESQVDNVGAGGIQVSVNEKGITKLAFGDYYKQPVTHHPDTGLPLVGFQADGFDEVVALALRASRKFSMFGTVGWDIAFTTDGPMIIEANTRWGSDHQAVFGPFISDEIAKDLKKWNAFSRYPKEILFPGLQKKSRWPWSRTRWWA